MKKIAVFASGTGSNTARIIEYFRESPSIEIALVVCNRPTAGVLQVAAGNNIPSLIIDKERFLEGDAYIKELKEKKIDLIVLAGFLWKIPVGLIKAFPGRIINIHPALLPAYGGKGMYGTFVHNAVVANKEKESGLTIHYVDEHYDHGDIIFQARCGVLESDTAETLARKIATLEHEHYPRIIEEVIKVI